MKPIDVSAIIQRIEYKPGWVISIKQDYEEPTGVPKGWYNDMDRSWYLQVENRDGECARTGEPESWKSGKRYLSRWMCPQEIVGICFDLFKSAEEHELREWFRYKGRSIYNAHLDPEALVEVASKQKNFVMRDNSRSMVEDDQFETLMKTKGK